MEVKELKALRSELDQALMKTFDEYLELTGQKETVTTEMGQGASFAFGMAHGTVSKFFEEKMDAVPERENLKYGQQAIIQMKEALKPI